MKKTFYSFIALAALAFSACAFAMEPTGIDAPGFKQSTSIAAVSTPQLGAIAAFTIEKVAHAIMVSTPAMPAERISGTATVAVTTQAAFFLELIGTSAGQEAEDRSPI